MMTKAEKDRQMCAYFENMAAKVGGNVRVLNTNGHFTMYRNGDFTKGVRVSMEDPRGLFNNKVSWLMKGD